MYYVKLCLKSLTAAGNHECSRASSCSAGVNKLLSAENNISVRYLFHWQGGDECVTVTTQTQLTYCTCYMRIV